MATGISLKKDVKKALADADFELIARLAVENQKVLGILISRSFNKGDVISWRAIEAMGHATASVAAEKDPAIVRNKVTRIIWSAREESGGMGWSAPELLGEIVHGSPRAYSDLPTIILSLHTEDEEGVFVKGVLWALGRMAEAGIADVEGADELVLEKLDDTDPQIRGLAARAAGRLLIDGAAQRLRELEGDDAGISIYEDTQLLETTVAAEASKALTSLDSKAG